MAIARDDMFPGVRVKRHGLRNDYLSRKPLQWASGPWTAGIRAAALDSYSRVQEAVVAGDAAALRARAAYGYLDHAEKQARAFRGDSRKWTWALEREIEPAQVLSIRAWEVHLGAGAEVPSRLVVQALVRLHTSQACSLLPCRPLPLTFTAAHHGTPAGRAAERRRDQGRARARRRRAAPLAGARAVDDPRALLRRAEARAAARAREEGRLAPVRARAVSAVGRVEYVAGANANDLGGFWRGVQLRGCCIAVRLLSRSRRM
jgi:hypothetical protein